MGTQMSSLIFFRMFVEEKHLHVKANLDIPNSKNYSAGVPNHGGDPSAALQDTVAIFTGMPQENSGFNSFLRRSSIVLQK